MCSLLMAIPTFCVTQDYCGMLNAILESDYQAFLRAKNNEQIPADKQYNLLDTADRMVNLRERLVAKHAFQAALCTELFYSFAALFGSCCGLGIIAGVIEDCARGKHFTDDAALGFLIGSGVMVTSGYFAIINLIRAYKKPKLLLDEALRIKDELYVANQIITL